VLDDGTSKILDHADAIIDLAVINEKRFQISLLKTGMNRNGQMLQVSVAELRQPGLIYAKIYLHDLTLLLSLG
jgi:hypothetical protein